MSDPQMPAVQPPEKATVIDLKAPPPWAIELASSTKKALAEISTHLDDQDTKLDKVVTDAIESNVRMSRLEDTVKDAVIRVATLEGRAGQTSIKVGAVSNHDLEQEAKLADLIVWRTTVATKDDLAKTTLTQTNQLIDSLKKNPIVSKALTIIGTAIITYLATHFGVHL